MALFQGEELVDITTPDGRMMKLPRTLAESLVLPTPAAAPAQQDIGFMPGAGAPPPGGEISATPLNDAASSLAGTPTLTPVTDDISAAPVGAPAPAAPDFNVDQRMSANIQKQAPEIKARAKAEAKATKKAAAYAATPDGQIQGASQQQQAAITDEGAAAERMKAIEATGQDKLADEVKRRNDVVNAAQTAKMNELGQIQDSVDRATTNTAALRQKIAETKIDRSVDHPIIAAISLALAGLGSAMKGESKNPALEILWKTIDRKVEAQMQDLEQKGKLYGFMRDEITDARQKMTDRTAFHNTVLAGELDKSARIVEEMVARTSSETLRAEGTKLAAEFREKAANANMNAVQFQVQFDQKDRHQKQQLALGYAQLKQGDVHFNAEMKFKREQLSADMMKWMSQEQREKGKSAAEIEMKMQEENRKFGLGELATGEPILTARGYALRDQADKLQQQAAKLKSSGAMTADQQAQVQMLEEKASLLRGEAGAREQFKFGDESVRREMTGKYAATQQIIDISNKMQALYDQNGRSFLHTTAGQAEIQTLKQELGMVLKDAWQLGAMDKGVQQVFEKTLGKDPTKWDLDSVLGAAGIAGTDPDAFKARLDAIANGSEGRFRNDMKANKWNVTDPNAVSLFYHAKPAGSDPVDRASIDAAKEKTPAAIEKSKSEGVVNKAVGAATRLGDRIDSVTGYDVPDRAPRENPNTPGLSEGQGRLLVLSSRALASDDKKANKTRADEEITKMVRDGGDTGMSYPTLSWLKDNNQELYTKYLPLAPTDVKERLEQFGKQKGELDKAFGKKGGR